MTKVDEAQLRTKLGAGRAVVADFYADWCPPCRVVAPELDTLEQQYGGSVDFVKVDVDTNPTLANELGVMGIPTIVHFSPSGEELARTTGAAPAQALALRLGLDKT